MILNEHKHNQFLEILELLGEESWDSRRFAACPLVNENLAKEQIKNGLMSALESLSIFIAERLVQDCPKVSFENRVIFIEFLPIVRALELFLAYFGDYCLEDRISLLKDSVKAHLDKAFINSSLEIVDRNQSVGITLIGYTKDNKHIDNLDFELKSCGISIVYLCNTFRSYENSKDRGEGELCIVSNPLYFARFSNVKMIVSTNTPLPLRKDGHLNTQILHLGHNFNESLNYTLWRTDKEFSFASLKKERFDRCDFIAAHTQNDKKMLDLTCDFYGISKDIILPVGNLSLDWALKRIETTKVVGGGGVFF